MRESWTDPRLDDMNRRMEAGFNRVDDDIRGLRSEMNQRFDALQHGLQRLQQAMIALAGSFIAGFAALIGLIATQL